MPPVTPCFWAGLKPEQLNWDGAAVYVRRWIFLGRLRNKNPWLWPTRYLGHVPNKNVGQLPEILNNFTVSKNQNRQYWVRFEEDEPKPAFSALPWQPAEPISPRSHRRLRKGGESVGDQGRLATRRQTLPSASRRSWAQKGSCGRKQRQAFKTVRSWLSRGDRPVQNCPGHSPSVLPNY